MPSEKRQHSYFELFIISLLIFIASLQAFEWSLAGAIPIFHALFLLSAYLLLRLVSGRLHSLVGSSIFAASVLLLVTEISIYQFTGLHLNKFILSLLFQPDASNQTGISGTLLFSGISIIFLLCLWLSSKMVKPAFVLKGRLLAISGILSLGLAQFTFGILFFHGQSDAMEVKRELPFFYVAPSYYTRKFFGLFWDQTVETPFGYKPQNFARNAKIDGTPTVFTRQKNILLIVTDSLRSKDLEQNPSLAPNLNRFFKEDYISYNHLSTANCTHFSFYSMLTGELATSFGQARRKGGTPSLIKAFAANGYKTSTSEATSLDWYDVSSIILPAETKRTTWEEEGDELRNDNKVTEDTLESLKHYADAKQPFFHLAYYYGNHFPYLSDEDTQELSLHERYLASIRTFDTQVGKILDYMTTSGLTKDTIVIVTSDHGEELREGGIMGHSGRLSDEQIYVPLWLSGMPEKAVQNIRSHIDIPFAISAFMEGKSWDRNNQPIILTNCDYDFPNAFAVLRDGSRNDFLYDHGYLSPVQQKIEVAEKKQQIEDANLLLGIIKDVEN